jgi:TPR repeat protein
MSEAAYSLGLLYEDGLGVQQNETAAIRLLNEAADAGSVQAMLALGVLYQKKGANWGSYSLRWLEKAEKAGNPSASNILGVMKDHQALHESRGFEGPQPRDFEDAMKEFRKAAAGGDCDALMNIGGMYFNGDGVTQDKTQARVWFSKEQGCKGATNGMKKEAARFLAKLDNGQMPAVQPAARSASAGDSTVSGLDILLGGLAIGLGAAIVNDMNSTPEERKKKMQELNDLQNEVHLKYKCHAHLIYVGNNVQVVEECGMEMSN